MATAGWIAALLIGQLLWLLTIDAGNLIGYEHWGPSERPLRPLDVFAIAFIVVHACAVLRASRAGRFDPVIAWVRANLPPLGGVTILALFIGATAYPSRDLGAFAIEVVASLVYRVTQLATLWLAFTALPQDTLEAAEDRVASLLGGTGRTLGLDRVALGAAVWCFVVSATLGLLAYEWHPHVPDEFSYLWHAAYFAEGRLHVPVPPVPEAFEAYLFWCEPHGCASPVPPGWPAMLAVGTFVGATWLVNPFLAALIVLLAFELLTAVHDRRTGRVGALLFAASPWFLFVSMSAMTHNASLIWTTLAALASIRSIRGGTLGWAVVGGVALGLVGWIRPLEGVASSVAIGAVTLVAIGWRERRAWTTCTVLAAFAVAVGGGQLVYNAKMTGDALTFPINEYADRALGPGVNAIGFGPDKGTDWGGLDPFPGHGLPDAIVNAALNTAALNEEVFGWSIGSLLLLSVLLLMRRRGDGEGRVPADFAWLWGIGLIVFLHAFYWYSGGPDFGARYWYLTLLPILALSARGLVALPVARTGRTLPLVACVLCVGGLLLFVPWRAIDKYHDYRRMQPDVRELRETFGPGQDVGPGARRPDAGPRFGISSTTRWISPTRPAPSSRGTGRPRSARGCASPIRTGRSGSSRDRA